MPLVTTRIGSVRYARLDDRGRPLYRLANGQEEGIDGERVLAALRVAKGEGRGGGMSAGSLKPP